MTPALTVAQTAATPLIDLNPFHWIGGEVAEGMADVFTSAMLALWSASLWLMQLVFSVLDQFLTPDVAAPGLTHLYSITVWLSLVVALMIGFGQVGLAAIRRDGRALASLALGIAQYGGVLACWVGVCAGCIYGSAGLSKALLSELLHVNGFSGYSASAGMPNEVTGTVQAAVLGLCGLFLVIPAAFGYLLVMLVREAGLLILVATLPISAAGALGEGTRAWMWKSIRWFIAACLTSPLLALVVGVGAQIAQAAFPNARADAAGGQGATVQATEAQVGTAVVGSVVFAVACFCPMVLFRLLAVVDPGTSSGASFRMNLAANGGISGLVSGSRSTRSEGSGAATQVSDDGRAASESGADAETANRFQSKAAKAFGAVGKGAGKAMDVIGGVASTGASMGVDVLAQSGVGHQGYYDTTPPRRPGKPYPQRIRVGPGYDYGGGHGQHGDYGAANDPGHIDSGEITEDAESGEFLP
jgi:hypothetical protein